MSDHDPITLRPAAPEDEALLFRLYASTREEELAPLPWDEAMRDAFLRMQFDAQRTHYRRFYPNSEHSIILRDGVAAGRLWVERNEKEIRILDIALLPEHRGHGVGAELFRRHIREAEQVGRPLRHSVEKNNLRAMRFYERLGFVVFEDLGGYKHMEWRPAEAAPERPSGRS